MKNYSYTKSPSLDKTLFSIDEIRKKIILSPISPKQELYYQWEATINRIYYSYMLNGSQIGKDKIKKVFTPLYRPTLHDSENQIYQYKKALDYLYQQWLVSSDKVTSEIFEDLYSIVFPGKLHISASELDNNLKFIQMNPEHPIVQAALSHILVLNLYPFTTHNEQFAHLVFLLFLYKNGYDFRRMIVIEQYFYKTVVQYKDLVAQSLRNQNLTAWLEYVIDGVLHEASAILKTITLPQVEVANSFFELNDRQKSILSLLDQPGAKIENRIVQKMFKVSQITASRDLAKLSSLGLLFPIGKGRSTQYTRY